MISASGIKARLINEVGFLVTGEYEIKVLGRKGAKKEPRFKLTRMIHSESRTEILFEERPSGWNVYTGPMGVINTAEKLRALAERLPGLIL